MPILIDCQAGTENSLEVTRPAQSSRIALGDVGSGNPYHGPRGRSDRAGVPLEIPGRFVSEEDAADFVQIVLAGVSFGAIAAFEVNRGAVGDGCRQFACGVGVAQIFTGVEILAEAELVFRAVPQKMQGANDAGLSG